MCNQQQSAPMGFKWGQQVESLEKELKIEAHEKDGLYVLTSDTAPISPPNTNIIQLSVDPNFGLVQIAWGSEEIADDARGSNGKNKYFSFKKLLIEKYGEPDNETEVTGLETYTEPDQFYKCLDCEGCGKFCSTWKTGDGSGIYLLLKSSSSTSGFILLIYLGPDWDASCYAIRERQDAINRDAF